MCWPEATRWRSTLADRAVRSDTRFMRSGKVRDLYELDTQRLLLVASDRISAFDVVLPTPIPDKGRVLTGLSRYWFRETAHLVPNHLLATDLPASGSDPLAASDMRGRLMVCRRAEPLPVEVIVRGYLAGSAWQDYQRTGAVSGIALPPGLQESERFREPLFTPSTKAQQGHDQNIGSEEVVRLVGQDLAEQIRSIALALYRFGAARAERAGIILADTKFEFGLADGELLLIDEVLTPDSSRFWDADAFGPGRPQGSYDKQFVRDWLEQQPWDKTPPGPELPADVVAGTQLRYVEAFERITGGSFDHYLAADELA
ncbi:MAG: phosphoribosylaminoimidazolesuccinocarboxamide synthase [Chloroflexi bacterium]|nr:phosphoribosylaminoimidazolesuccinocarboxamide synthase [Chloroflexota bacterium]